VKQLEKSMLEAARNLEFERAAQLRDQLNKLKEKLFMGVVQ
jgi:excinuclease ABC subunit B